MHKLMRYIYIYIYTHFTQQQSQMTQTNDVTTDGKNYFSMYFNKFMIYSKLVNGTNMRKNKLY